MKTAPPTLTLVNRSPLVSELGGRVHGAPNPVIGGGRCPSRPPRLRRLWLPVCLINLLALLCLSLHAKKQLDPSSSFDITPTCDRHRRTDIGQSRQNLGCAESLPRFCLDNLVPSSRTVLFLLKHCRRFTPRVVWLRLIVAGLK